MRRIARLLGVTLLEIMLVLAIAALIIVMSVRYFQSASTSQQATAFLSQLQAITAAANSLSQGTGSYSGLSSSSISSLIPGGLKTPWGGTVTVAGTAASFTVTPATSSVPGGVCTLVTGELPVANWVVDTKCSKFTYSFNPGATTPSGTP